MNIPILTPRKQDEQSVSIEPEELLVVDARAGLTPAQMVEQKLLTLLDGQPGLFRQAIGRPVNIRMPGR